MSGLTTEQLAELTERINARLAEWQFSSMVTLGPKSSPGFVRLIYDAIQDWEWEHEEERDLKYEVVGNPAYWENEDSYNAGYAAAKREMSPARDEAEDKRFHLDIANANGSYVGVMRAQSDAAPESTPPIPKDDPPAETPAPNHPWRNSYKIVTPQKPWASPEVASVLGPEHTNITPLRDDKPRGVVPDPDVAREKLATALAGASGGALAMLTHRQPRTLAEVDAALDDELEDGELESEDEDEDTPRRRPPSIARLQQLERLKQERKKPKAVPKRPAVQPSLDEVLAELKRQAMAGVMPAMAAFDDARPATWATASAHCHRLNLTWTELGVAAGLKPNPRGQRANASA